MRLKINADILFPCLTTGSGMGFQSFYYRHFKNIGIWGIESSFRALKYTLGMVDFHSKKVACILQEIYAHLIMYNFAETVTSQVSIRKKQRKHTYKANFTVAVHMCRLYYLRKTTLQVLEAIISKNLLPIRPDRSRERKFAPKVFRGFLYRVA